MSHHRSHRGFTIVELVIVISIIAVVVPVFYSFFASSFSQYFTLAQKGTSAATLAAQTQTIAAAARTTTDISEATDAAMTVNAYYSIRDSIVSQIRYYKSANGKLLLADVTPYTANPPAGTLDTSKKRTVTISNNFFTVASVPTFEYLDASGTKLTTPISDLNTIKGVRINMVEPNVSRTAAATTYTVQVSLRNRKTNL